MKKLLFIIILTGFSFSFHSCEEFLEENPLGLNTSDSYFQTEKDAWSSLNGVYEVTAFMGIRASGSSNSTCMYSMTMCADDMHYRQNTAQVKEITDFSFTPSNSIVLTKWTILYRGVSRANNFLDNIDRVEIPEATKNQMKGEARFLRGFYYFYLVRLFGDVPLIDKYLTSADLLERSPAEDVYKFIISDFEFAYQNLSPKASVLGRATKGAAAAFLSKVHLTRKEWAQAASYAEKVIQSGEYTLLPDIMDYFDDNKKESNTEAIFECQAAHDEAYKGTLFRYLNTSNIPENSSVPGYVITGSPSNVFCASWDLFFSYEPTDRRRTNLFIAIAYRRNVYPSVPQDSIQYPWTYKYRTTSKPPAAYAPNFPYMRYSDVFLMYAEALNEQGKTNEAYPWINMVRRRAFGLPISTASAKDLQAGLSQSSFREVVYKERRLELACEGHRWFDLVRTGRLISTMNAFAQRLAREYSDPALSIMSGLTPNKALFLRNSGNIIINTVSEKHVLYPIPQMEIDVNPLLTQNPGY